MPTASDARLEADFEQLCARLGDPDNLSPVHGAPVFYFVYEPRFTLTVRRLLPGWISRLENEQKLQVEVVSLSEILWRLVDRSSRWDEWLELESSFSMHDANEAVSSVLQEERSFLNAVVEQVLAVKPGKVVFIRDVELIHPYAKTRPIEGALHNKAHSPVVFFYPGERVGQYGLRFLSFYPEDQGYRSTLIGGNA